MSHSFLCIFIRSYFSSDVCFLSFFFYLPRYHFLNTSLFSVILKDYLPSSSFCVSSRFKVQGSRFLFICHIHNHTGYNQ